MVRDHLENLGMHERIILKCIFKKWDGGISRIDLVKNRDRRLALVNAVMILRIP
jgi:hypothetical protein